MPSLIDGSNKRLEIQHEWQVSEIRKTDQVHDSYLTRNNNNFLIEVRGRNGELVPGVMVSIALTTEYSTGDINLTLQTAPNGRIILGVGQRLRSKACCGGWHSAHSEYEF